MCQQCCALNVKHTSMLNTHSLTQTQTYPFSDISRYEQAVTRHSSNTLSVLLTETGGLLLIYSPVVVGYFLHTFLKVLRCHHQGVLETLLMYLCSMPVTLSHDCTDLSAKRLSICCHSTVTLLCTLQLAFPAKAGGLCI